MIEIPSFLQGAGIVAAVTAVGAFWSQAKGFARYLTGFLVLQKTIQNGVLRNDVAKYIRNNYKRLPSGISIYGSVFTSVDNKAINSCVPFDLAPSTSVWRGPEGTFILDASNSMLKLMSLRFVSDPRKLVTNALIEEDLRQKDMTQGNFFVSRVVGTAGEASYGGSKIHAKSLRGSSLEPDEGVSEGSFWTVPFPKIDESWMYEGHRYLKSSQPDRDPLAGLFFPKKIHTLLSKLDLWYARREWYQEHHIPWKTGVLLHGIQGTGKSSLSRVVAERLRIPLYQFMLNTLTDTEFLREWEQMQLPCVVALEDFDTAFNGRESVTIHKSLSFEVVLNAISGITATNGVLLMVSTNRLECIDPALGRLDEHGQPTRPGRIDYIEELGFADEDQRRDIANYIFDGWASELTEQFVAQHPETTPAQFQNICIQEALKRSRITEVTP